MVPFSGSAPVLGICLSNWHVSCRVVFSLKLILQNISQLKALSEVKVVSKESFVLITLLRRGAVYMVRCLTNEWPVILGPVG